MAARAVKELNSAFEVHQPQTYLQLWDHLREAGGFVARRKLKRVEGNKKKKKKPLRIAAFLVAVATVLRCRVCWRPERTRQRSAVGDSENVMSN